MRPKHLYSSKKTRRARDPKNIRKQKKKYPDIAKKIILDSHIILQVLDARYPDETRNLELEESIKKQNKKIIYVLNKADLIEKKSKPNFFPYVFVSCVLRKNIKELRDLIKKESKQIELPDKTKFSKITVGVLGYPNTGKSSLINLLIGRNSAKTGSDAGFTKGFQKLKLTSEIQLIDSPGVIPEKEYSNIKKQEITKHTKVGGRSYSQVKEPEMIISKLMEEYPKVFEKFYKIKAENNAEILLEKLGRKSNFLKKGNKVNFDQTARLILKDLQRGEIRL